MDAFVAVLYDSMPERPERLGFHSPLRSEAELAIYRAWQELFAKEVVKAWELEKALDEGFVPELFLRKVRDYVLHFGHRWWSRKLTGEK
jgi:hypothetical protein